MEFADKLPDSGRKYLDSIHKSGRTLLKLIEDLLEAGKTAGPALEVRELKLGPAIDRIVEGLRPEAERKGIALTVDVKAVDVEADESMFGYMVASILDNAVKFTPAGGMVDLSVFEEIKGERKRVYVRVTDTGAGISPELKDVIFNPFEVGEKTLSKEHPGLGLGLALTKRFVEFHGGEIRCQSEPGKGSTFEFFMPSGVLKMKDAR
jgi:signal transduction histidine kinase